MAQVTKFELTQQLSAANKTIADLRMRVSVLEGAAALRPRAAPVVSQQRRISIRGIEHDVLIEKHGARVIKRFVPVSAS